LRIIKKDTSEIKEHIKDNVISCACICWLKHNDINDVCQRNNQRNKTYCELWRDLRCTKFVPKMPVFVLVKQK